MGSGNRVEELETRVRELEATVTGLTDELLECKQRLGELEEHVDDNINGETATSTSSSTSSSSSSSPSSSSPSYRPFSEEDDSDNTHEDESEENTDLTGDEIIVA